MVRHEPFFYKININNLHISRTSKSLVPPISILFPNISVLARCLQLHDGHFSVSGDASMKKYYADADENGRGVIVFGIVVVVLHHAAGRCHTC